MTMNEKSDEGQAKVAAKIAAITGAIKGMTKDAQNPHFKYDYTSIQETVRVIGPLLAQHNLAFVPSITDVKRDGQHTTVYGTFSLICGETGASITVPWIGEGMDNQDKGINKAIRAAQKYFLLITFLASTEDEKEADGSPEQKRPKAEPEILKQAEPPKDARESGKEPQLPGKILEILRGRGGWIKTASGLVRDVGDNVQPVKTETRQHVQATLAMGLAFDGATEQDIADSAKTLLEWLYDVQLIKDLTELEGQAVKHAWLKSDGVLNEYAKTEINACLAKAAEAKK